MAIDWLDGGRARDSAHHVLVSHNSNGLYDDVARQELVLLRGANEALAGRTSWVGLLAWGARLQPDSKLLQKIGFWNHAARAIKPKLFADKDSHFSAALNVSGGLCLLGGVFAGMDCLEDVLCLGERTRPGLFVWTESASELIREISAMAYQGLVILMGDETRKCHLSHEVLSDICRRTSSCICVPTLAIDVDEAVIAIIDPLDMLAAYLQEGVGKRDH